MKISSQHLTRNRTTRLFGWLYKKYWSIILEK